jgi:hypothetical protein
VSQPYGPPWSVTGIALPLPFTVASEATGADPAENTSFQPAHWCAARCLATPVVSLAVSRSLPSNWPTLHNTMGTKNHYNGDLVEHTGNSISPSQAAFSR